MSDRVNGAVPGPHSTQLGKRRADAVPKGVHNIVPIFVQGGHGAEIVDVDGNRFIDLAGGFGVLNLGHANERVLEAVHTQVDAYLHECFGLAMYEPYLEVAEALNRLTPGDHEKKTLLVNSGAEAVENAVKVARYFTGREGVIAFSNGFHGRTLMGMALTAKQMPYKHGMGPFAPGVHRVPFAYCYRCPFGLEHPSCGLACADFAADVIDTQIGAGAVACIVIEPVQGEGGIVVAPDDYLPALRAICSERDILFIDDEIQSGMGRTGKLFAAEHYDLVPDIVTTAKSLAAGLPLSGVTGRSEIMDSVHPGGLGSTYGGNPVACVAALAVLAELTESDLMERGRRQGELVMERMRPLQDAFGIVGDVRGLGPMIGIELVVDERTKEPHRVATEAAIQRCHSNGVLVVKAGTYDNVVRLLAPLVISDEELHEGLDILTEALEWANRGMPDV
jgi:4-aminobutyrate aminotransferase/(S)-3-amino-2-methylpropionate transaminase